MKLLQIAKFNVCTLKARNELDAATGCIIGAFCGDAIGATLEFPNEKITQKTVETAITLPGGGTHKLAPGQITDDSELAMCLMKAILEVKRSINS